MAQADAFWRRRETGRAETLYIRADMAQRAELELDHRLFPEPIRRNHRRQHAERANAGMSDMGERQQQDFQIGLRAVESTWSQLSDQNCAWVLISSYTRFILTTRCP